MSSLTKKQTLPFGMWPGSVSPELISQAIRLQDVQWVKDGSTLTWCQSLSGKASILARPLSEAPLDLTGSYNPSGGVGYGGGEFCAGSSLLVFADKNGRLYRRSYGHGSPTPITPAFGSAAAPVLSPDGQWVIYVHTFEGNDLLALVDSQGQHWPKKLSSGADFYMQPAFSPDGKALVWVEWDHPNMPWDGTRLMFAILDSAEQNLVEVHQLDGGLETPTFQPEFSPDGRYLSYLTNRGKWDQLFLFDLQNGKKRTLVDNCTLIKPAWVQGVRTYAWSPDSFSIYFIENKDASNILRQVNLVNGETSTVDLAPYTTFSQISVSSHGEIALIATAPTIPPRLITWKDSRINVIARSQSESLAPTDLPQPMPVDWTSSDGEPVYGIYYPPTSSKFQADGLPPLVVYIHGGPTSQVMTGFDLDTAFFTSRGFAYLVVNYRGSTGYGRSYMTALRKRWGDADTMDAAEGALAMVARGLADPGKLIIKGGSAGGYTVLNALERYPGLFKAGICSYGVSNLFTLEMDTHKFEAHYNASLVGELPEAAQKFHDWSPIFHADKIKDAIIVFQGKDDKVVPQAQSDTIVEALRANGVPHEYHLYDGEGHGFRKSETLVHHYKAIDRFLKQYVIFN